MTLFIYNVIACAARLMQNDTLNRAKSNMDSKHFVFVSET